MPRPSMMTDMISPSARVDWRRSAPVPPSPEALWQTAQLSAYTAEPSTAGTVVVGAWVVVGARVVVVVGATVVVVVDACVVVVVGASMVVVVDSTVAGGASVVVDPPPSSLVGTGVVDGAVVPPLVPSVVDVACSGVVVAAEDGSVVAGAEAGTVGGVPPGCVPTVVSGVVVVVATRVVVVAMSAVELTVPAVDRAAGRSAPPQPPATARTMMSKALAVRPPWREVRDSTFIGASSIRGLAISRPGAGPRH